MEFGITNVYGDIDEKKEYQEVLKKYHYNQRTGTIVLNTLEDLLRFEHDIDFALVLCDGTLEIYDDWRE